MSYLSGVHEIRLGLLLGAISADIFFICQVFSEQAASDGKSEIFCQVVSEQVASDGK